MSASGPTQEPWPWPPSMDALQAAPASHRLLFDSGQVRVLEVVIEPGVREPEHTHQAPSFMIVDEPARIRYYQAGMVLFESEATGPEPVTSVHRMDPEGPHSVENLDEHRYHAFRIEFRGNPVNQPQALPRSHLRAWPSGAARRRGSAVPCTGQGRRRSRPRDAGRGDAGR
jgi:hypothetical protein